MNIKHRCISRVEGSSTSLWVRSQRPTLQQQEEKPHRRKGSRPSHKSHLAACGSPLPHFTSLLSTACLFHIPLSNLASLSQLSGKDFGQLLSFVHQNQQPGQKANESSGNKRHSEMCKMLWSLRCSTCHKELQKSIQELQLLQYSHNIRAESQTFQKGN